MGKTYQCLNCKYVWKSRKERGESPKCPRCNSKCIKICSLASHELGWIVGISGLIMFIFSLFNNSEAWNIFGIIGLLIGFPLIVVLIFETLSDKNKNDKRLKKSKNSPD